MLAGVAFGQDIHLKTRTFRPEPGYPAPTHTAPKSRVQIQAPGSHQIVDFDHAPDPEDIAGLLADGFEVVGVLPDNAVVVTSTTAKALLPRAGVRWAGPFEPADKLSPEFGTAEFGTDRPVMAIVEFHKDVSIDTQDAIAAAARVTLSRSPDLMTNHVIVTASLVILRSLAAIDEVAYIFPAEPALLEGTGLIGCNGMLTVTGAVPQYANIVHGWDLDADRAAHLNYVFGSVTPRVLQSLVQSEVVRALNEWAKNANLIFQAGTNAAAPRTIVVKFVSGAHGDAYPFQGYGSILAHTFYPVPINPESIAGDMHMNADENWHSGADVDIYSVALHEAGHAIGLGHSDKPGDVMYPYYRRNMVLSAGDIGAAQALYGPAGSPVNGPVTAAPVTGETAPLQITVDPVPVSTSSTQLTVTGIFSGGSGPYTAQWQTDHASSGVVTLTN